MSKRAFISLPIAGRTFPDILTARNNARETLHRLGYATVDNVDYEILSNMTILANNGITRPDLYLLAQGLKKMSQCDAVYFCVGWGSSRECQIEYAAAEAYGLKIMHEDGKMNRPNGVWIPCVWGESKGIEEDGCPEGEMIACCDMPMPGDEILTSVNGYVWADTAMEDDDGYYLDSGLEWQEVDAWMPMPQPYRENKERTNE